MIIKTLYARNVTNSIQTWSIDLEGDKYRTISGQLNSPNMVTTNWTYSESKNIGKKNETNSFEQASKEATALIKKKIDEGYWEDINDIDKFRFFEPMLAYKYRDYGSKLKFPVGIEDKLNGVRSCHFKRGSYSRKGKEFHNIKHIRKSLSELFEKYPNLYLDGELFNYELKNRLGDIVSLVSVKRQPKDITPEIEEESRKIVRLVVYDGYGFENITKDTDFQDRRAALKNLLKDIEYVSVLNYKVVHSHIEIAEEQQISKDNNEEGRIIRVLKSPYENKRSKFILKLKNFEEEEFEVCGIEEGTADWEGCAKKIICKLNEPATTGETTFISNIDGDRKILRDLFNNKDKYINGGYWATVRFQEYSPYKIPLIPFTSLPFRDYE